MSIEALIQDALKPRVRDLQGQSVLVTGASSGIGLATAVRLAQLGCNLHLAARREERLKQIKGELSRLYPNISIKHYPLDLTHKDALAELDTRGAMNVDILINNAGLAKGLSTISKSLNSDWSQMIDTNITSAFEVTRHTVRNMIQKKAVTSLFCRALPRTVHMKMELYIAQPNMPSKHSMKPSGSKL